MSPMPEVARKRPTITTRTIAAGWTGPNAQALAAKHCDATGHPTWCDVALSIRYGRHQPDSRQIDIEDAIKEAVHG